jgi:hypothetical protein
MKLHCKSPEERLQYMEDQVIRLAVERAALSKMLRAMARRLTEERRQRRNLIEAIGDPKGDGAR